MGGCRHSCSDLRSIPSPPTPSLAVNNRVDHILYVVNSGPASILWLSLPAHILLPQRTTQFAYPVALLAMLLMLKGYQVVPGAAVKAAKADSPTATEHRGGRRGRSRATSSSSGRGAITDVCVLDAPWMELSDNGRRRLFLASGLITGLLPLLQVRHCLTGSLLLL